MTFGVYVITCIVVKTDPTIVHHCRISRLPTHHPIILSLQTDKQTSMTTTTSTIAYDVSSEMARRIVQEARLSDEMDAVMRRNEIEREAERNRLNVVFYTETYDHCYRGLHHMWEHDGRVHMKCIPDIPSPTVCWGTPICLTPQHIRRMLTRKWDDDEATTMMVIYKGSQEPEEWLEPGDDGFNNFPDRPPSLTRIFKTWQFHQELECPPSTDDLVNIVKDVFPSWSK